MTRLSFRSRIILLLAASLSIAATVWLTRQDNSAHGKADVISTSDHNARLARLDALAKIKDEVLPTVDRDAQLARLDALARIKDDVIP